MRHIAILLGGVLVLLSCKSQEEQILARYRDRVDRIEKENAAREATRTLPGGAVVPAVPQPAPEAVAPQQPAPLQPVTPPERTDESADRKLQRSIQAALGENTWLGRQLEHVEVSVQDGKIVLTGQVRTRSVLLALERRVAAVPGAEDIETRVVVKKRR